MFEWRDCNQEVGGWTGSIEKIVNCANGIKVGLAATSLLFIYKGRINDFAS